MGCCAERGKSVFTQNTFELSQQEQNLYAAEQEYFIGKVKFQTLKKAVEQYSYNQQITPDNLILILDKISFPFDPQVIEQPGNPHYNFFKAIQYQGLYSRKYLLLSNILLSQVSDTTKARHIYGIYKTAHEFLTRDEVIQILKDMHYVSVWAIPALSQTNENRSILKEYQLELEQFVTDFIQIVANEIVRDLPRIHFTVFVAAMTKDETNRSLMWATGFRSLSLRYKHKKFSN